MKVLVVSDIHGDSDAFEKIVHFYQDECMDQMIILGDTFNTDYELNVAANEIRNYLYDIDNLIMIRGNCDSSYDLTLTPCGMLDNYEEVIGTKRYYFHHGHRHPHYNSDIDVYVQGHTHVARLDKIDETYFLNPGSLGRPRDFTDGTFMVISDHSITIFDIHYQVIYEEQF